ncbi:hypothetical protein LCGC14_3087360 [marine sediment metagenome]|uniref:Uncharacterized protein n=1 Tax=marine sediment metagenome TaxID=412755 RepID=A0A0F8WBF4_9ZZZZ
MKLRRSDFYIGDYPSRRMWRSFKSAIYNREFHRLDLIDIAAMAIQRANSRGLRAITQRMGMMCWLLSVLTALDQKGFHGKRRNSVLVKRMRSVFPQQAQELLFIAAKTLCPGMDIKCQK